MRPGLPARIGAPGILNRKGDVVPLGLLASHRGSNLQAILDACATERLPARVAVAICNNPDARALQRARSAGVPALCLNGSTHPDTDSLDRAIRDALQRHEVRFVVLAGYMKRLGPAVIEAFRGRILNLHPGPLPRYGGRGMYGMRVHEAVVAAGERETAITVHLVDEEYDRGPVLATRQLPVLPDDTPESLAQRVLAEEHRFYVEVLGEVLSGQLSLPAG